MTDDDEKSGHPRKEEVVHLFQRGLKFTEELLAENERLRFRVASLESGPEAVSVEKLDEIKKLQSRVKELEEERTRLLASFKTVEEKNRDYQAQYAEIEEEHNNLANLYISSYQLHATLSFAEVMQVITEIVINLVGVARFAIYLRDAEHDRLIPVVSEGRKESEQQPLKDDSAVGRSIASREINTSIEGHVAIVPLTTQDVQLGAIVIDELLVQKSGLTPVDHELFRLLGAHAATAIIGAVLRERSGSELRGVSSSELERLQ